MTEAMTRPAAPSDQPSDERSRQTPGTVGAELLHEHREHQQKRRREHGGNRRARQAAGRKPLTRARDGEPPGGNDQAQKEDQQHDAQPAVDRGAAGRREQAHQRGDPRVLTVPQRGNPADAHQPDQQQAGDLLGPGDRLAHDVTADDLQPDDGRLRDHEDRDRPVQQPIREGRGRRRMGIDSGMGIGRRMCGRHPRINSSHEPTPSARPSSSHSRSATGRKARPSISRMVIPLAASCAVADASSCAPIARWWCAASRAARSSGCTDVGRKPRQAGGRRPEAEHAGDVTGAGHVARDLVEPLVQRGARVVLVAVDDPRLHRRVDFAEGHRRRARAHQLDRLDVDRRLDRADLEAGQLAGFGDVERRA